MKTRLSLAGVVLFALPTFALADACASGTVAALLGQGTCTIGDLIFDFTSYSSSTSTTGATGFDASEVNFTPITNGFELSGDFSAEDDSSQNYLVFGTGILSYMVGSSGVLDDVGVSLSGNTLATASSDCCVGDESLAGTTAENSLSAPVSASAYIEPSQFEFYGDDPVDQDPETGPASFTPTRKAIGEAVISATASSGGEFYGGTGTASASFSSADFTFSDPPAVAPEPSSIVLLGTVALGLIRPLRRWRRSQG